MAALAATTACLDDAPMGAAAPMVRATLNANVVGALAGGTVRIRVGYRTSRQGFVALPSSPEQVTLAAGTTVVVPVTVDIGPCLADESRATGSEPGCLLTVELTLTDATGATVDTQTRDARTGPVTPGQSVDFGTVTVGITVSTITVAPASLGLSPTEEQRLTATVRDASGAVTTAAQVTWAVGDATVAQLTPGTSGTVTVRALKLGTTSVTASAGGKTSAAVPVNVIPPPPLTIQQSPASGCVIVGQTVTLNVVSPPGAVTWSIANTAVATIGAATGVVTGVALGQTTVTATSGLRSGTASVCVTGPLSVTPPSLSITAGRTAQLTASNTSGGTVTFVSSATNIATVDATGLVRGVGVGQSTITTRLTAASGTQTVTTPVTVSAAGIVITPSSGSAALTRTARFTANVQDAAGATIPGVSVNWAISDATVGSLSATSATAVDVVALKVGTTTVRATLGSSSATAQFTATQPLPPVRLAKVSGDGAICLTRSTGCTFVVRALDVNGAAVPGASVSWSGSGVCGSPTVIVTDDNGLSTSANICSAVPAGTYTQVATLLANQQQVSFAYTLRGLVLTSQGIDSFGAVYFGVATPTVAASGLKATVEYKSGPATNYVTALDLDRTTTPATLRVVYNEIEVPFGTYTFDVIVSTTTSGIGPGMAAITFTPDSSFGSVMRAGGRQPPRVLQGILKPRP